MTFLPCSFVPEVRSRVLPTSFPPARFVSHAILPSVRPHVRFLPFHAPRFLAAVLMSLPGATLVAFVVTLAFLLRLPCTFLWLPTCAMRTGCFPDARDTSMSHARSSTLQRNQKRRRNATCDGAAPPKEDAGRQGGDASRPVPDEDRCGIGQEILVGERRGREGRGSRVRLEGRVGSNAGANRIDPRIDRGMEDPREIVVQGRTSLTWNTL